MIELWTICIYIYIYVCVYIGVLCKIAERSFSPPFRSKVGRVCSWWMPHANTWTARSQSAAQKECSNESSAIYLCQLKKAPCSKCRNEDPLQKGWHAREEGAAEDSAPFQQKHSPHVCVYIGVLCKIAERSFSPPFRSTAGRVCRWWMPHANTWTARSQSAAQKECSNESSAIYLCQLKKAPCSKCRNEDPTLREQSGFKWD